MSILQRLKKTESTRRKPQTRNGFSAAEVSRLTASLASQTEYINRTLRYQLRTLRARSREAVQNEPYGRRFVNMVVDNVCGPDPFILQAKCKFNSGKLDRTANQMIEREWKRWGQRGCEITHTLAYSAFLRLVVRTLATDGEALVRKYRNPEVNAHGYQLQLIDIDRLDEKLNKTLPNGGAIHMGIEVNAYGRPINYYLLKRKASNWAANNATEYEIIPAGEIEHIFIPDFAEQSRGIPWMYAALLNLVHLGAFEEAAVIAARVGASQMGFIQTAEGGDFLAYDGEDAQGNPQIEAEPGIFPTLPPGYQMSPWQPRYPDAAIQPFVNSILHGLAAGLNVAHHNLSGDMSAVNYSSARIAELNERDTWKTIQNHLIEHPLTAFYNEWLEMSVLTRKLPFQIGALDKYREVRFQPKRWPWVDPAKEINAAIDAKNENLKSATRIMAEQGMDIEDVYDEIAFENQLAKEKGIKTNGQQTQTSNTDADTEETANAE